MRGSRILLLCLLILFFHADGIGQTPEIDPRLLYPRITALDSGMVRLEAGSAGGQAGTARWADEACDSDWDGAAIGLAVGVVPGALILLTSESEQEGRLILGSGLFLAGAPAGFWGGLAVDSLDCPFDPDGEREPE